MSDINNIASEIRSLASQVYAIRSEIQALKTAQSSSAPGQANASLERGLHNLGTHLQLAAKTQAKALREASIVISGGVAFLISVVVMALLLKGGK